MRHRNTSQHLRLSAGIFDFVLRDTPLVAPRMICSCGRQWQRDPCQASDRRSWNKIIIII